jgi:hypothetical protein
MFRMRVREGFIGVREGFIGVREGFIESGGGK